VKCFNDELFTIIMNCIRAITEIVICGSDAIVILDVRAFSIFCDCNLFGANKVESESSF